MAKTIQNVYILEHPGEAISYFITDYKQVVVIVDENTKKHCYPLLKNFLPKHHLIEIKSGEEQKNLGTLSEIWQEMTDLKLSRNALCINLGGGVIGDMGGFAAATFKRGIHFLQCPTTLLAMVDAAVGGKLGVDFNGFKNHIGIFWNPLAVFVIVDFIKTLPEEQLRSGYAEIIKHCLITSEKDWDLLREEGYPLENYLQWVKHSVQVKQQIVTEDPRERKGIRKKLNFGHTAGHALETYFLTETTKPVLHGYCVAAGMLIESWVSVRRNLLSLSEFEEIKSYLLPIYGKLSFEKEAVDSIAELSLQDKKNTGDSINLTLLTGIGQAITDVKVSQEELKEGLLEYLQN